MVMPRDDAADRAEEELDRLLAGYRPLPGIYDEMVDARGVPRAHWQPLLGMLAALGSEEIDRRFSAADRHLRESGVFYRVYEDPTGVERTWPLSHIPLVISAPEWETLKAGLVQRAELLEAVVADCYGQAKLVAEGRLPAALVAGNPEFLRPLVGVAPPGGAHVRFYAVNVGRAADGRWWVLGDRTQAPSGAGYALETRLALSRAMPDIYRALRVNRVAPFFQAFQAELTGLGRQDNSAFACSSTQTRDCALAAEPGELGLEGLEERRDPVDAQRAIDVRHGARQGEPGLQRVAGAGRRLGAVAPAPTSGHRRRASNVDRVETRMRAAGRRDADEAAPGIRGLPATSAAGKRGLGDEFGLPVAIRHHCLEQLGGGARPALSVSHSGALMTSGM